MSAREPGIQRRGAIVTCIKKGCLWDLTDIQRLQGDLKLNKSGREAEEGDFPG